MTSTSNHRTNFYMLALRFNQRAYFIRFLHRCMKTNNGNLQQCSSAFDKMKQCKASAVAKQRCCGVDCRGERLVRGLACTAHCTKLQYNLYCCEYKQATKRRSQSPTVLPHHYGLCIYMAPNFGSKWNDTRVCHCVSVSDVPLSGTESYRVSVLGVRWRRCRASQCLQHLTMQAFFL